MQYIRQFLKFSTFQEMKHIPPTLFKHLLYLNNLNINNISNSLGRGVTIALKHSDAARVPVSIMTRLNTCKKI